MSFKSLNDIPLETVLTVEMPQDVITPEGVDAVQELLRVQGHHPLPEDWEWSWLVTTAGKYSVGTLPKRVAKWFYTEQKIKLPQEFLSELGNVARRHANESNAFSVDFTKNLDWKAGAFGDTGSCFWGGHSIARKMLQSHDARAMRYWRTLDGFSETDLEHAKNCDCYRHSDFCCNACGSLHTWEFGKKRADTLIGVGRLWVIPDNGGYYAINAYGPNQAVTAARILSTMFGLSYTRVSLRNHGESSGVFYINSGSGYFIAPTDVVRTKASNHDFQWTIPRIMRCDHCDRYEGFDEQFIETPDSRVYCPNCWTRPMRCSYCNRFVGPMNEATQTLVAENDYRYVCTECASDTCSCAVCSVSYPRNGMARLTEGHACSGCSYAYMHQCINCGVRGQFYEVCPQCSIPETT